MSISTVCPACKHHSVDTWLTFCPSCKAPYPSPRVFRVRWKSARGWLSKVVPGLALAKRVEAKFRAMDIEETVLGLKAVPTLSEAWRLYHDSHGKFKRSESDDCQRFKKYLEGPLGGLRLDRITVGHVEDVLSSMTRLGRSPATQTRVLAVLSTVFSFALRRDLCRDNPCRRVKRPRVDNVRTRVLNAEEVDRFLSALTSWPNRPGALLLRFMLLTGIRRGQARSTRWEWVDIGNATVTYPKETTKNGKGQTLPLSKVAVDVLKEVRGLNLRGPKVFGPSGHTDISRTFQYVARRAGIEGAVLHDLRRSFGSWAVSNGVDLYTVSKLLGHSSTVITQRTYAHLDLEALRKGVDVVGSLLGSR